MEFVGNMAFSSFSGSSLSQRLLDKFAKRDLIQSSAEGRTRSERVNKDGRWDEEYVLTCLKWSE